VPEKGKEEAITPAVMDCSHSIHILQAPTDFIYSGMLTHGQGDK